MAKRNGGLWVAVVLMIVLVFAFEIIPAGYIIISGFTSENSFTFQNYIKIFSERYYTQAMVNSIMISAVSTVFGIIIGTAAALCLRGMSGKLVNKFITFLNMTTNYSGIPLAFAFIVLLGSNGLVTLFCTKLLGISLYANGFNLYSWTGLVLVYVYFQIPLAVMLMYPAVDTIKDSVQEAASMLGAGKLTFWFKVGIPMLLPALLGSICILFANALGAYATAYALVSSSKAIIAIAIANLISGDVNADPNLACALSTILGGILMILVFIKSRINKRLA